MPMGDIQPVKRRRKVSGVLVTCLPKQNPHDQAEEGGGRRPRTTARQCHRDVGKPAHSERVSAGISALVVRITAVPRAQLHNA